jgi:nicotinate-nucleotide adenylyltransferase
MKRKIGLFFGSFNPIHAGHLIIANYFVEATELDEVWLVVSPQNPFKTKTSLLNERQRLYLANVATEDNYKIRTSDIEFKMPKPSYTVDTLIYLDEKYPTHQFSLIMGSDNLLHFAKWKNHDFILKHHSIFVYPRPNHDEPALKTHEKVAYFQVPLIEISSTQIRDWVKKGRSIQYLVPDKIINDIENMYR